MMTLLDEKSEYVKECAAILQKALSVELRPA